MANCLLEKQRSERGSVKCYWAIYIAALLFCLQVLIDSATAEPVLASSLGFCKDVPVLKGPPLHCCLPEPQRPPIRFQFPTIPRRKGKPVLRERKPAHVAQSDPDYVRKYNLAYGRMKALPDSDPRSFLNQWRVHCSFCNEAFQQRKPPGALGSETGVLLQVHYSWTFLPWHRMFLYYHERILASLIDDPTFALPFWNWDNVIDPLAAQIPAMYLQESFGSENSSLYDEFRNSVHFPPKLLHLGYNSKLEAEGKQNRTDEQIKYENLCVMWNQVTNKVSARDFHGGPYVAGTDNSVSTVNVTAGETPGESGGCETVHNTAHEWVGLINDPQHPDNEDMGNFIFAARDPIFYAHHSNVDRLWEVWRTLPDTVTRGGKRRRADYTDRDFLESEFTFFDENGDLVIMKIKDTLYASKLGYKFTDVSESDSMWINYKPLPPYNHTKAWNPEDWPACDPSGKNTIGSTPVSYRVDRRPPTTKDCRGKGVGSEDDLQENILLEKVRIPRSSFARFDVFINYPDANRETHLYMTEYVGTFTHLPSGMVDSSGSVSSEDSNKLYRLFNVRFSIEPALRSLGIDDYNTDIVVTIVSKGKRKGDTTTVFEFSALKQDFQ